MKKKTNLQIAREIRERCSQPVVVNTNFTRGQVETLKRRYQTQFEVAKQMYPKLVPEDSLTDELTVRYAVFEVITKELHESMFNK